MPLLSSLRRHLTRSSIYLLQINTRISMAHWSATCISSESSDTNLAILIDCNSSKYLFNCGEGTTRTLLQRRRGFRKFTALFATGIDTDRSSGLPGLLMTIADSGGSNIKVFGPTGLDHFLASTRLYTMRESLSLKSYEVATTSSSPVFADENISVFALPIYPKVDASVPGPNHPDSLKRKMISNCACSVPPSKRKKFDTEDLDGSPHPTLQSISGELDTALWSSPEVCPSDFSGEKAALWRQLVVQHMFPGKSATAASKGAVLTQSAEPVGRRDSMIMRQLNKPLPRLTRELYALSYIVVGASGRGKFDAAKAEALGLKNGPLRGRLAKGETIVTAEGKTVTPDMVLGPAPKQDAMIFIDCPSSAYIPCLTGSDAFSRFQHGGEYPIHCMFHLVGPKVLDDDRYRRWLESFGNKVHHLVAGQNLTPDRITFTSSAYAQLRLSHLDSHIFHVPKCLSAPPPGDQVSSGNFETIRNNHFIAMKPAQAPVVPPDNDGIDLYHPAIQKGGDIISLLKPKTIECFHRIRQMVAEESGRRILQPGDDVTVTPLGTSSAMPSKYRNVSSLLVQIPGSGNILLDCGEGTMGQLRRHFGEDASSILRGVRCAFISHIHGDHHIGLSKLLSQRKKLNPPCDSPIYLVVNQATFSYIQEYNDLEDLGLDDPISGVRLIYSENANWRRRSSPSSRLHDADEAWQVQSAICDLQSTLNLVSIATVEVWHRGHCYGLVIKHQDGWSLVYSGDTRPTDNLVRAGHNATLLIHEATLGDDQADIAAVKAHSTIGQAIDVAKRMNVKNVLLTHFSTRFPKTPQMTTASAEATDLTVAIAFDHTTVSFGNLWKLNRYLPAIEQSFLDGEDPEEVVHPLI